MMATRRERAKPPEPMLRSGDGPSTVAIFADAGPEVGLGHLRRSTVLAHAFAARGASVVLATPTELALVPAISGLSVRHGRSPRALPPAAVTILDGYGIDLQTMAACRRRSRCAVVVDDMANRPIEADLVLNPNIYGDEIDYRTITEAAILGGAPYCPVDPRFPAQRDARRAGPRVLVAFGGTDDGTLAAPVIRALRARTCVPIEVVLSPLRAPSAAVAGLASSIAAVTPHHGADMVELMGRCTLYVGAGGSTVWEASAAGLDLVVAAVYDNQIKIVEALADRGLPALPALDPDGLADAAAGRLDQPFGMTPPLIDGRGAQRVVDAVAARVPEVVGA
jgi:spore coat polysaccharide biosynthesis predicted glycosyltransferase SpsG